MNLLNFSKWRSHSHSNLFCPTEFEKLLKFSLQASKISRRQFGVQLYIRDILRRGKTKSENIFHFQDLRKKASR